jgi:hypothetical protein
MAGPTDSSVRGENAVNNFSCQNKNHAQSYKRIENLQSFAALPPHRSKIWTQPRQRTLFLVWGPKKWRCDCTVTGKGKGKDVGR